MPATTTIAVNTATATATFSTQSVVDGSDGCWCRWPEACGEVDMIGSFSGVAFTLLGAAARVIGAEHRSAFGKGAGPPHAAGIAMLATGLRVERALGGARVRSAIRLPR